MNDTGTHNLNSADATRATVALSPARRVAPGVDLRNLALLIGGFACVVLLIPPARAYPMIDDWIYSQTISGLLKGDYQPHDWSVAWAFSHNLWGALFAGLFGLNFTTLTVANLVASGLCIVFFYLLLRHLDVSSSAALFGSIWLVVNPVYFHLTYSFMTDVTFLACFFAAALCYIRGLRGHDVGWLWLGGAAATFACLNRQFGIALLIGVLAYIWLSGSWSWRRAIAAVGMPVVALALFVLWERTLRTPLITGFTDHAINNAVHYLFYFIVDRGNHIAAVICVSGLVLLPLVRRPRKLLAPVLVFACLALFLVLVSHANSDLFPVNGNVLDVTGYSMFLYNAALIWNRQVWTILGVLGAVCLSLYLTPLAPAVWRWLRSRPYATRQPQDPALLLYISVALMTLATLFLSITLFDRYFLPVVAVLSIPGLRSLGATATGAGLPAWRWALLLPFAVFALVGQRDYAEHAAVRWNAAETLAASGVPREHIDAGFEWQGLYLFAEGANLVRQSGDTQYLEFPAFGVLDPVYVLADQPRVGYAQVASYPYSSWLDGGQTRQVLLLKRIEPR